MLKFLLQLLLPVLLILNLGLEFRLGRQEVTQMDNLPPDAATDQPGHRQNDQNSPQNQPPLYPDASPGHLAPF